MAEDKDRKEGFEPLLNEPASTRLTPLRCIFTAEARINFVIDFA